MDFAFVLDLDIDGMRQSKLLTAQDAETLMWQLANGLGFVVVKLDENLQAAIDKIAWESPSMDVGCEIIDLLKGEAKP